jgi:hypothetical protein
MKGAPYFVPQFMQITCFMPPLAARTFDAIARAFFVPHPLDDPFRKTDDCRHGYTVQHLPRGNCRQFDRISDP